MAISLSGSGQYLTQGTAIVSALPLTLACWFNPTSTAATGTLLSISNNSSENSYFILVMIGGGVLRAQQSTANTAVNAASATSMTANTWYHCAAVFTPSSRTVYLNGVSVTNAAPNAGGLVNVTAIGTNFQGSGTALNVCNGTIAYEAVWNVALSSTDIANLYNSGAGSDPRLIQGGSIVSFSLLQSGPPFADQGNSSTWTTTGSPLVAADPFSVSGGGGPVADGRFGFATHFNQGWPTSLLPLIAATGVGYIRDNLTTNGANGWEPSTGTFQVSPTDKVWCNLAHSNGLKVVGIMGGNNLYPTNQFYDPTLMGNRAAFIAQSGLVDVIEVLNEPNNAYQAYEVSISRNWLTDLPILTTACTNAVNAVSSTVQVIGLGAQGSEIWGMYPSTTVDGIVYHPYDTGNSKAAVDVPDTCYEQPSGVNATSSLVYVPWISICRGQTTLPLWETEWGVQQPDVLGAFTEDNQADYLVRRLLTAAGLAVEHTFIYAFKDNSNPGVNQDCFGVYNFAGTTAKASYAAVTNTISALSGVIGTPSSIVTISSVANGDTADVKAYLYQGPGKTVASLWFGNFSPSAPPAASTANIHFAVASVNNAIVTNPIAGTSVPLSTYTNALSGGQLTITGIPISDHPLLIVLNTDTSVTPASSSKASVTARTNLISVPPFFIQRAINHVTAAGAITCPVNTATTGTGNLLVVCIGSLAAGTIISSVTDNIGNVYTPAFSNTSFNASLLYYYCAKSIAGSTVMTVVSSASVSAGNLDVVFYEFSAGSGSTWSFDTDAMSGTNAGTTFASSGATGKTRQSNEILIGACAATGTTVTTGDSVGGWTGSVTGLHGWSEYLKVSASSTYTSSFTLGLSGNAWAASIGAWYALAPDIRTNTNPMSTSNVSVSVEQMSVSTDVFVQTANNRVTNSGAITCPVALNPSGTGTGNLLVVYIGALASGAIITSVTDDKGNVYTLAFNDTVPTTSLFCYQCLSCIAGVTTVTVLSSAAINANTLDVSVYEMSGLGAWHFDQFAFAGANNSGTTLVSAGTTPATTFANEVVISACFANGTSVTAGTSGFTGGAT